MNVQIEDAQQDGFPEPSGANGKSFGGARIDFQDMSISLKLKNGKTKTILDKVSGCALPGRLTALMGPSGSGKTSLLNALAGRTRHVKGLKLSGLMSLNGVQVDNWAAYRRLCAYVEQDDLLFHTLTVSETLMLAAQLRLPKALTNRQRVERVEQVISELGLRKCANTRIGNSKIRGVSGGERKRVSIALEILRGPTVLFLDECTSGLDSFQALRVVQTIKDLAKGGKTIVTSIHQPRSSIYTLFDDLILLSEGELTYFGPANHLVEYFTRLGFNMPKNFNPADFALDTVSIDVRSEALEAESRARHLRICDAVKSSPPIHAAASAVQNSTAERTDVDGSGNPRGVCCVSYYEAPFWLQFLLLAKRALRQRLRDPSQLIVPLCISVFFGLVLGFVYFQNGQNFSQKAIQDKSGMLFFISLNQSFNGLFSVLATFPAEKEIVNRERSSRSYAVFPYFTSKTLADIPMLICPFLFFTIAYWLAGFKPEAVPYLESLFICFLVYLTAASIGLVCSALVSSTEAAQGIAMPFMLIFALFSGFYANTDLIPAALAWIQYISPIRWAFSGFMTVLMSGLVFECPSPETEGCIPTGDAFLHRLGLGNDSFIRSAGILMGMILVFQVIGYLALEFNRANWMIPKRIKEEA